MATPFLPYKNWEPPAQVIESALNRASQPWWLVDKETKDSAFYYYRRIRETGGRPSRPVRTESLWQTTAINDEELQCHDNETGETFNVSVNRFWRAHWFHEYRTFKGQYDSWQNFLRTKPQDYVTAEERAAMLEHQGGPALSINVFSLRQWRAYWSFQRDIVAQLESELTELETRTGRWVQPRHCKAKLAPQNSAFETLFSKHNEIAKKLQDAQNGLKWISHETKQILMEAYEALSPATRETLIGKMEDEIFEVQSAIHHMCGVGLGLEAEIKTGDGLDEFYSLEDQIMSLMEFKYDCDLQNDATMLDENWRELRHHLPPTSPEQRRQIAMWQHLHRSEAARCERLNQWESYWRIAARYFTDKEKIRKCTRGREALAQIKSNEQQCRRHAKFAEQWILDSEKMIRIIEAGSSGIRSMIAQPTQARQPSPSPKPKSIGTKRKAEEDTASTHRSERRRR